MRARGSKGRAWHAPTVIKLTGLVERFDLFICVIKCSSLNLQMKRVDFGSFLEVSLVYLVVGFFNAKVSETMNQPNAQFRAIAPSHNLEAHQLLLVGIVGTTGTLIAFVFCSFIQAFSFGLLISVFAYSLILTFMEREDHSTWKSANHWDESAQAVTPGEEASDFQASQLQSETGEAQ
jgi:hypothetical protein